MKPTYTYALVWTLGLLAGNAFYQLLNEQMWGVCIERTFFQAVALFGFTLAVRKL